MIVSGDDLIRSRKVVRMRVRDLPSIWAVSQNGGYYAFFNDSNFGFKFFAYFVLGESIIRDTIQMY